MRFFFLQYNRQLRFCVLVEIRHFLTVFCEIHPYPSSQSLFISSPYVQICKRQDLWTKTQLCVQYVCVSVCKLLPLWDLYIIKLSNSICLNLRSLLIQFNSARVYEEEQNWNCINIMSLVISPPPHTHTHTLKASHRKVVVFAQGWVTLPAAWKTGWPSALFMVITETLTSWLSSSPPPSSHALSVRHYNGQSNSHDGVTASSAHRCSAVTSAVPTERGVNCQH